MARPMTILQVVPELATGGAERTTLDIADAVVRAGGRAIVVSEGGRMLGELIASGAEHVTMPVASKRIHTMRANARRLADLMETEAVDLIHARSRAPAWSALWAASWSFRPFVTTYHGVYNERSVLKNRYNSVMARGDIVIANSAYTAGIVAERHPFARPRIVTIHRGIDLDAFAHNASAHDAFAHDAFAHDAAAHVASANDASERAAALRAAWGVDPRDRVILQLARLTPWKGQEVVIDALALLRERLDHGWACVFAGDDQGRGGYRARLAAKIRHLGLESRARLVGHVVDVPGALAGTAVAVQASIEPEAFGRAAVEAQAAHVPVIVTDHGASAETVLAPPEVSRDRRTGWRVPPRDAAALADAMFEALQCSGDTRAEIGFRGRAHALQHFSLPAMKEKTLRVYRSLLEDDVSALY